VGAVVVDATGRVLVVRRARPPSAGEWTLPGGRVEAGETLVAAALREVLEETGVAAQAVCPLGVVEIAREGFSYAIHEHLLVAPVPAPAPEPGDDAAEARWAHRRELAALAVRDDALAVIDRGLAEARSRALIAG
jgi:ADP-ribose pyrophosphatase YjhB (NUDIX family)